MQNLAARSINNDPIKYAPDSSDDDVVVHLKVSPSLIPRLAISSKIGSSLIRKSARALSARSSRSWISEWRAKPTP